MRSGHFLVDSLWATSLQSCISCCCEKIVTQAIHVPANFWFHLRDNNKGTVIKWMHVVHGTKFGLIEPDSKHVEGKREEDCLLNQRQQVRIVTLLRKFRSQVF